MYLPCRLRWIRERQEIGLRDMADRTGVNRGTLSAIENGRTLPKDEWLPAMETAYGVKRHEFYPAEVAFVLAPDSEAR
jgi:transcriptional regulator with XRE-family HTH domain